MLLPSIVLYVVVLCLLKKIMGRKEEGNAPPCTNIILRQRHNGMSSRLLTWLSIVVKVIKKKKSRSRSLDTYYCSVFVIFLILWTIFWAHIVIFAELYIILHGHAVSNNRLADFCRPLFPIYLELDFNYMKLMTYRKMQLDSTLQKSFLIRIMHRIYNTTTHYLIVIMPAKLENQTNDLSFAILFWNEGRNLLVSDSSQMFSDLSIIRHLMIGPSKIHLRL